MIVELISCSKNDIESLQNQINNLDGGEIASVETQIKNINTSITELTLVTKALKDYTIVLKEEEEEYEQQITILTEVETRLNNEIAELQEYVDKPLKNTKRWTEVSFTTLGYLDSLSIVLAETDMKIDNITERLDSTKKEIITDYKIAIKNAVSNVEASMSLWINELLSGYNTIAEIDARLDSLSSVKNDSYSKLDKRIEEQKNTLKDAKNDLTSAYKMAIEESINTANGKISIKIASDITTAKSKLQNQVDVINEDIVSIKVRLTLIEENVEALLDQVQSISVIPQDSDGSIKVDSNGYSVISFDIKPKEIANELANVWRALSTEERTSMISLKIKEISKQDSDVPVDTIKTVTYEDNELKIGVKFAQLHNQVLASLQITYGQSDVSSEYFTIYPESKPKHYITPTGIAVLSVNPIYLSTGTQASLEFRVNPSNATFDMSSENCQIVLDNVGIVQRKSSYVRTPSNYKLTKIEYVFDSESEELKVGQYRAIIEDTKKSAEYDEMAALVLNVKDANGDNVQISSSAFEIIGENSLPKTGLPIVVINTPNSEPIDSKDIWKESTTMTIINADMTYNYQGTLSIKGRGNTTWSYPKKPYAIKLDSKSEILGMPKHKRWCLLANWMDRTMIRNAVSFEIARKCSGLEWTPSGKYVELILNGSHLGNYYLCEQIKVDKKRVNIAELDNTSTEGEGITGGYIMELDTYYDEVYKFHSVRRNLPWMFKDPDEVNDAQFNYIQNYVNSMEDALYDDTKFAAREFTKYIDLESFVDWWFVYELASNWEPNHPKSSYMNKDKNGKIKAGPVWDFDYCTYTPSGVSSFNLRNAIYYDKLLLDSTFKKIAKERWISKKSDFLSVQVFIDDLREQLRLSDIINHEMWPITDGCVNGDENMTYDEAIKRMKNSYLDKLEWMDNQISTW